MQSHTDRNFPGDTDGKFLSKDTDSTRALSGDTDGKCKSDTVGKRFTPGKHRSLNPSWNSSLKGVSGDTVGVQPVT